ncbi:MAG: hypothetical protein RKO24_16250, partial [Candidatus Competibacter sp.]|nr:hypothetical protein [Candidatus Competibacter sp.]
PLFNELKIIKKLFGNISIALEENFWRRNRELCWQDHQRPVVGNDNGRQGENGRDTQSNSRRHVER